MKSNGIDRILQIIERVENKDMELLSEHDDVSGLQDNYFDSVTGKICSDSDFSSCSKTVIKISYATDEIKNSGSRLWDRRSNYWIIQSGGEKYVIRVLPDFNTQDNEIERDKSINQQKTGSGKIISVWLIKELE